MAPPGTAYRAASTRCLQGSSCRRARTSGRPFHRQDAHVADGAAASADQFGEPPLTLDQSERPQVLPVKFQQIKGEQDDPLVIRARVQLVEARQAILAAVDRLAVEDRRLRPQAL